MTPDSRASRKPESFGLNVRVYYPKSEAMRITLDMPDDVAEAWREIARTCPVLCWKASRSKAVAPGR